MKIPVLRIYTIGYLLFLYCPIVILPIFAFNNSTAVAFPLQGFTTQWFVNVFHDGVLGLSLIHI
jgi:spermidine/putrescine transport system permease protein